MQGFMSNVKISKAWWRMIGILLGIGVFSICVAIGFGIVFLYDHLVWQ